MDRRSRLSESRRSRPPATGQFRLHDRQQLFAKVDFKLRGGVRPYLVIAQLPDKEQSGERNTGTRSSEPVAQLQGQWPLLRRVIDVRMVRGIARCVCHCIPAVAMRRLSRRCRNPKRQLWPARCCTAGRVWPSSGLGYRNSKLLMRLLTRTDPQPPRHRYGRLF